MEPSPDKSKEQRPDGLEGILGSTPRQGLPHFDLVASLGSSSDSEPGDLLFDWISEQDVEESMDLTDGNGHEALVRAEEKRKEAERMLGAAKRYKEGAMRKRDNARIAKAQADNDAIKAEEEGEEKVSSILDNARSFTLQNTQAVEAARAELRKALEELEALTTAHRRELESVTRLARTLSHNVGRPDLGNDGKLEAQRSDFRGYSAAYKNDPMVEKERSPERNESDDSHDEGNPYWLWA